MTPAPSPLKSDTARANGALSNGPVTAEGKAKSSQNALRHGLCSKQTVLPGEDQAEFDRRKASYFETYKPQSDAEKDQVEILASTAWRLKRIMRLESALFADENTDPLQALARIARYEGQLNRAHARALAHLKELQQARAERTAGYSVVRDATSSAQRNEPKPASSRPENGNERTAGSSVVRDSIDRAPIPGLKDSGRR